MNDIMSAIGYGGKVAAIGILIVFFGLALLIFCITIMAKIFDRINAKKEAAAKAAAPAPAPVPAAEVPAPAPVEASEEVNDEELIAVIAAAIAAFDNSGKRLVVRKVRRVSAWNKSSREEQVCRF